MLDPAAMRDWERQVAEKYAMKLRMKRVQKQVKNRFNSQNKTKKEANSNQISEISFVNFASLAEKSPPRRTWVVDEWIPRGTVTALYGQGGIGKSLLAQQLAIAVANGEPWLGMDTNAGNVLGFFCEDDSDELLRRAYTMFDSFHLNPIEGASRLFLDARAGKANTLVTFGTGRELSATKFLSHIREQCEKLRPALLILDNIAQMFGGQENDRYQVTSFCNLLTSLARDYNCAVFLLGHPAKQVDSQYSGSTAWEAAVRTRIFLERRDDGTLLIRKAKANYSELEGFQVEYQNGILVRLTSDEYTTKAVQQAMPVILSALKTFTNRQESCSNSPTALNYIIKKIVKEGLNENLSEALLKRALNILIDTHEIIPNMTLPWKNSSRHSVQGLVLNNLA
jgi:RecA-family ATPase